MNETNGQGLTTIEVPEYAFTIEMQPGTEQPWYVGMQISTSGCVYKSFLCLPIAADVERISRVFGRELLRVATTLKRKGKRIELVTGVDSASLRTKEGR
jgi:hypothetical protein